MRRAGAGVAAAALVVLLDASAALAQKADDPASIVFGWLSARIGIVAAAIAVLLAGLAGFVGKWAIDQFSAARAKQRDFVANTGTHVVNLAWSHYWALANATGTLAGHLTGHLRLIDAHLLVVWESPADLATRMREIAQDTERASFVSFVRLLHEFERFQFRGSNTYLLPHHAAGETLRRLYNRFIESLGEAGERSLTDIRLAVERKLDASPSAGKDSKPPDLGSAQFEAATWFAGGSASEPASALSDAELQKRLDAARARYRAWLAERPAAVAEAADTLRAFSRLLTHELAQLHAVWHRDRGPLSARDAWRQAETAVATRAWPGILDEASVETIRRAREVSSFFTPLASTASPEPPQAIDAQAADGRAAR